MHKISAKGAHTKPDVINKGICVKCIKTCLHCSCLYKKTIIKNRVSAAFMKVKCTTNLFRTRKSNKELNRNNTSPHVLWMLIFRERIKNCINNTEVWKYFTNYLYQPSLHLQKNSLICEWTLHKNMEFLLHSLITLQVMFLMRLISLRIY